MTSHPHESADASASRPVAAGAAILPAPEKTAERIAGATPAMRHYLQTRIAYPECLLFYRMGDFYELFYEDAEAASACLNITLTRRAKQNGEDIPMCGVPHHSYAPYLNKLIKAGYKVAVCEQLETPEEAKKRGYKAVVKRDVVRIVTRGTLIEEELLEPGETNYLLSIAEHKGSLALSWADISTGAIYAGKCGIDALRQELSRLQPKELLLSEKLYKNPAISVQCSAFETCLTLRPNNVFDPVRGQERIKTYFKIDTLNGIGDFTLPEQAALGALIEYIDVTMCGSIPRLSLPTRYGCDTFMNIDRAARESLELIRTRSGDSKGALLHTLNATVTAAGSRLLASDVAAPLTDPEAISRRLNAVSALIEHPSLSRYIRELFTPMPDSERALSRLCLNKGSLKDILHIRDAMRRMIEAASALERTATGDALLNHCRNSIGGFHKALRLCEDALDEDGTISVKYHATLDSLRDLKHNSAAAMEALRDGYRSDTGIKGLKVNTNNVLGWHIDVSAQHADVLMKEPERFIHRQSLANSVRFTTDELRAVESKLLTAEHDITAIEQAIIEELRTAITSASDDIARAAYACARLDVMQSFAHIAVDRGYTRPVVDNSTDFIIKGGRHPVVERLIGEHDFTGNDCDLTSEHRLWLVTGPNMAGKSTFLRQNALIAIMAHIGCFVPALSARIGVVDKLFSRVGAADNLGEGQSTFMVEMTETAGVVNNAGPRSLVIMDEIGRGTSTYDGVSIAWSVIEHVYHTAGCRALCATHYHELAELETRFEGIGCYHVMVKEWDGDIIFLHKVARGSADRSYGIHVGKIAGLPPQVISRAQAILSRLEPHNDNGSSGRTTADIDAYRHESDTERKLVFAAKALTQLMDDVNPEALSPRDALDVLYRIKQHVSENADTLSPDTDDTPLS